MEELKIQLDYKPEYFKEIYYQNGQGNILTHKEYRNAIIIPLILILITLVLYFLSFRFPGISWLIVLGLILVFSTGVVAIIYILKYFKWKKGVTSYLKDLAKYKSYSLKVNSTAIELTLDSTVTIDRWETIKSAIIKDDYLLLRFQNEIAYILPAKSMTLEEYEKIKEITKLKVKE